jgi:hypothetical protein
MLGTKPQTVLFGAGQQFFPVNELHQEPKNGMTCIG